MLDLLGIKTKAALALAVISGCAIGGEGITIAIKNHEIKQLQTQLLTKNEQLAVSDANLKIAQGTIDTQNKELDEVARASEKRSNEAKANYDMQHKALATAQQQVASVLATSSGSSCQDFIDTDNMLKGMVK